MFFSRAAQETPTEEGRSTGNTGLPEAVGKTDTAHVPDANDTTSPTGSTVTSGSTGNIEQDDSSLAPVPGAVFVEIPVDHIRPNPRQPREVFDEDELAELVASIRELGVLQPVVVRRTPPQEVEEGAPAYELVMGERRLRASQAADQATIPAILRATEDEHMLRDALLENLHRAQLNPLEEAAAYQQLLEDFGCTHDELAGRIGRSRPQISNTIRLLKLPPMVQRRVASGVLSAGHARALLGLPDGAAMERMAQRIVAEGLSVRSVEEIITLGSDDAPPRRRRGAAVPAPDLAEVADTWSGRLDTRVQVSMGRRKGKMVIEFAGKDDLDRILDLLEQSASAD
ncbi:Chromosome (plasmid) partitioning protein ParB [Serinicoccus hydrothermalis]|uniref:Chromosome (Plasmid) partitioning protein ParB n=1 Tax=Serinicoccus hydrothermalis TaxID=1758689 RepID=A0A1B1ND33_9MICO|nr:Chromosome (plasmid) partitioning protein ParB [Serinicoccus hydrothermalis]